MGLIDAVCRKFRKHPTVDVDPFREMVDRRETVHRIVDLLHMLRGDMGDYQLTRAIREDRQQKIDDLLIILSEALRRSA